MATVKFISDRKMQTRAGLSFILRYCQKEKKTQHGDRQLVTGINCLPASAYREFVSTKLFYRKDSGRMFYHLLQSFHPDEAITPETAHEIAVKFASEQFKGYEVLVATHVDKEHIHSHFIINSVNSDTGNKYHADKDEIQKLRNASDKLCLEYGLTVVVPVRREVKPMSAAEYRSADKCQSWKVALAIAIDDAMQYAKSKQNFIEIMEESGYHVRWSDERKVITYTTPDGKKCKDFKLHEPKYLKGNMEIEFRIRKEIAAGLEGSGAAADVNGGESRALRNGDGEQLEGFGSRPAHADRDAQEYSGRARTVSDRGRTGQSHERSDDASGAVQQGVGAEHERFSAGDERHFNESPEGFKKSGAGFGTVDEHGGEGYCLTGWEDERGVFEAFILGEGISYYRDETTDVDFVDTGSYTADYDASIGTLVADLTDIIDEDRPIEDCTTIHYPKERKKHQQGGGPVMGGM
jgi:Relaxase/Mobilisation nuclease domain.